MLIYKRANFTAGVEAGQQKIPETKTDEDRIQELKNEIKDLRDNNPENDGFNAEIMANNELNSSLTDALLNNRKTLNNLVKELSKIIEKNPSTTTEARNLLILLQGVQEKAEFNRLNGIMSAERINLNDLGKFNDQEIKLVCDYIKNNYGTKEIVSFREKMKRIDYSAQSIKIENKKAASNYQLIKDAMSSFSDNPQEQLKDMQLNEIFENIKADKLKQLAKDYLGVDDWKGEDIPDDTPMIIEANKRGLYSSQEFVGRFNAVNKSRKSNNEKIADDFSLSDDALTKDNLKDFKVVDNKLQYKGKPYENGNITAVFGEKHINPTLNKGDFIGDEKAAIESKICDKITNEIKDKLQNSNQTVDRWGMTDADFNSIKDYLKDKMFIEKDAQDDNVTYIPQKAKNYLGEFRDKEWGEIKQTFRTPEGMAYVAALQILLNADYGANIKVDGKWTDRGETREAVRNFQEAYNNKGTDGVNLDTDGLPGKRTLEALLDGQYGDTKLDGQWKINQDGKTITFLEGSGITIDHDNTGNFITIDNVRYYERKEGMDGNGYQIGDNGGVSYLYTGPFKNGLRDGDKGTLTRANGGKYVGEWKNGNISGKGTFTRASGNKYVGDFVDGEAVGEGTYTRKNGISQKGNFKKGTEINGDACTIILKDGTTELAAEKTKFNNETAWKITTPGNYEGKIIMEISGEFVDATNTTPENPAEKDPAVVEGIGKFEDDTFKFDNVNEVKGNKYVNIGGKNYYEYRNGMNGDGYMVVPKTKEHSAYVLYGHYENGVIMNGTVHDAEGNKYEGEFKDGKRSGKGTATMLDGTVLTCNTFVDGLPTGECTIQYGSGDRNDTFGKWKEYKGPLEWKEYKGPLGEDRYGMVPSGENGKMTWENGFVYIGGWENGNIDGKGTLELPNDLFKIENGEFKEGLIKKGKLTFSTGQVFDGSFENGWPKDGLFKSSGNSEAVHVTGDGNGLLNDEGEYVCNRSGKINNDSRTITLDAFVNMASRVK